MGFPLSWNDDTLRCETHSTSLEKTKLFFRAGNMSLAHKSCLRVRLLSLSASYSSALGHRAASAVSLPLQGHSSAIPQHHACSGTSSASIPALNKRVGHSVKAVLFFFLQIHHLASATVAPPIVLLMASSRTGHSRCHRPAAGPQHPFLWPLQ